MATKDNRPVRRVADARFCSKFPACRAPLDTRCTAGNPEHVIVKVTRSGGFAGLVTHGELDTTAEPDTDRLDTALRALPSTDLGTGRPQPDRYVYRLEIRETPNAAPTHHTVAEQDLTASTAWLLDRVLKR